VRTLGKWRDAASVPAIAPFLSDGKERRRAQAATALGDLGDPAAAGALIAALDDPVCTVRQVRVIRCYSRLLEHRHAFAERISAQLGVTVAEVDSPEAAARDADIVITATNSREPILHGEWLAPGTHVNAIGSNRAESREVDYETLIRSALVCVDSVEQAKIEAGDLLAPIDGGVLTWDRVCELGTVVAGKVEGRANRDDITFFKSLGLALEDVAVGAWVYERARERRVGKPIEL
jgi:ornithine cyclodeaminase/alanine dehydrogenase